MTELLGEMAEEEQQLKERIQKLNEFIQLHRGELPRLKRNLMTIQLNSMLAYHLTLTQRMSLELEDGE